MPAQKQTNTVHVIEVKSSDVEGGLNELLEKVKEVYGGEGKVKVKRKNKNQLYSFKYGGPEKAAQLLESGPTGGQERGSLPRGRSHLLDSMGHASFVLRGARGLQQGGLAKPEPPSRRGLGEQGLTLPLGPIVPVLPIKGNVRRPKAVPGAVFRTVRLRAEDRVRVLPGSNQDRDGLLALHAAHSELHGGMPRNVLVADNDGRLAMHRCISASDKHVNARWPGVVTPIVEGAHVGVVNPGGGASAGEPGTELLRVLVKVTSEHIRGP